MADEQIIVDIKVEDKEVNQAEKSIDRLTDSIEELGKEIKDARNNNKEYKKTIADLDKQLDEGTLSAESHKKQTKLLNDEIKKNNKQIAASSVALSKDKRERTANIKLIKSEVDSRDRLRQKISLLTKEYNGLNIETKEGRIRSNQLQKELKELNEEMNEGSKNAGNFKDNIGNYPQILQDAAGGVEGLSDKFKALIANPVVLILTIIVATLSALFSAFKKSENGAKLLEKAAAGLKGVMMVLTSIMNTFADAATSAFDDPEQAVFDLVDTIENIFINSLKGWIKLFEALINIDSSNLKESLKDVGSAMIQIGTGIDTDQQKEIADGLQDMADKAAALAEKMINLAVAQRAMRAESRTLEKDIAVLSAEFEKLSEIAGDDTRNLQEMRQAAIDAGNAAVDLAKKQIKLAEKRRDIINQEVKIRRDAGEDIQDLLDQQAEAEIALTEARSQSAIAQQKILIEQRKIERDIFEQNLDILLDVGDKIKTEQEKAIQNESLSLEKRKQLLEASKVALAANFKEIKKEYELYGVTAEQINEVINASDAKQTNEKLKNLGLNEIANNRLREIILEKRQAELDFNDLSKDLSDEEIERKGKANDKIQDLNDDAAISEIKDAEELKNKLIEIEQEKLELKLENENLLAEERELIILESNERIKEIEEENDEENLERITDSLSEISDITANFAGEQFAIFGGISTAISTAFEDGKASAVSALQAISIATGAIFSSINALRQQDLADLEESKQRELEIAGEDEAAKLAIEQKFDAKKKEIQLKQFRANKAGALLQAGIQTALGVTQALGSSPPPVSFILAALVGALGAAQIGIIAATKPPTFAKGTNNIVNIGSSHSSGNDTDVWGFSGSQKQYFGKVEKGEAMPVIRKSAANSLLINQLNGKYSSRGRKFQQGTNDITDNQGQNQNNGASALEIATAIQGIKIVAKIEDITKQAGKKIEIVDNSKV